MLLEALKKAEDNGFYLKVKVINDNATNNTKTPKGSPCRLSEAYNYLACYCDATDSIIDVSFIHWINH